MKTLLALLSLTLVGCAGWRPQEPPWSAPTPLAPRTGPAPQVYQATSLWADGAGLTRVYSDRRAREVGDLVTVLVVESSEASREASTGMSRDSSMSAGVSAFLGAPTSFGLNKLYGSAGLDPKIEASTGNSFTGSGNTKRKDVLRTRLAARVVNVLEDGNLVLEGRRQVEVNEETQHLFVRGIARPADITPDNTVSSVALADAQILYGGTGVLSSQQSPGWLYRIVDAVWPF